MSRKKNEGAGGALSFARIRANHVSMVAITAGDPWVRWMVITITLRREKENIAVSVITANSVTCPHCRGKGESIGFVCGTHCDYRAIKCFTCEGAGTVSTERLRLMELAEIVRKDRVDRRLTIREEGTRLGVDFAEWSRIEGGRPSETESGARALAVRYQELGIASES